MIVLPKPTILASSITEEWPLAIREILDRDGVAIRGPETRPTIEVKSLVTNRWLILELPGNGIEFASFDDRNSILQQITGT